MKRVLLAVLAVPLLAADHSTTCPYRAASPRQQQAAAFRQLSVATEAVTSGRRRTVAPPASTTPPKAANLIDVEIFGTMQKAGITPAQPSSDEEFLRRVTLDLTGQIPESATVQAFLADTSSDKRARTIDRLLASDAFVDRWTMWLGDLVQNVQVSSNSRLYPQGRNAYYAYLRDAIARGKPYDQLVRELVSGKGDSFASGPANYWVRQIQPNGPIQDTYDNLAAASGEKFLAMPMLCLSCHNGPGHLNAVNTYLATKLRPEFWGMAAFFVKTRAARSQDAATNNFKFDVEDNAPNGAYQLDTVSGNKTPRQPYNGSSTYPPAFLLTGEKPRDGEPWRDAYGRMLTSNSQFARATVNYLWKEMFGAGLVEPTNNIDLNKLASQPTHPNLLAQLGTEFIADKYDLRAILRLIATSNAYQLSARYDGTWNESWAPYFARHLSHRLSAEALLDAIGRATNVPVTFNVNGASTVTAAMKLPDTLEARNNIYGRFLDQFGRGNRDDEARSDDSSITQALAMMNDATVIISRIRRANVNSNVAKTLASTTDPGTVADQLYLATLSRRPTSAERQQAIAYLAAGNLGQRAEDLQWVLLNSLEFLFD